MLQSFSMCAVIPAAIFTLYLTFVTKRSQQQNTNNYTVIQERNSVRSKMGKIIHFCSLQRFGLCIRQLVRNAGQKINSMASFACSRRDSFVPALNHTFPLSPEGSFYTKLVVLNWSDTKNNSSPVKHIGRFFRTFYAHCPPK